MVNRTGFRTWCCMWLVSWVISEVFNNVLSCFLLQRRVGNSTQCTAINLYEKRIWKRITMSRYNWISLLCSWRCQHIVNKLYSNKIFVNLKGVVFVGFLGESDVRQVFIREYILKYFMVPCVVVVTMLKSDDIILKFNSLNTILQESS